MDSELARFDRALLGGDILHLVGVDEAGRGCLAGPVVAAAVVLAEPRGLPEVDDSKRLTAARRERQLDAIREHALAIAWSFVGPREIERTDIRRANLLAMRRAVGRALRLLAGRRPGSGASTSLVIVDGNDRIPGMAVRQEVFVGGDGRSLSIAAASIVAKTLRDRFMVRLAVDHPEYGFERHKGYGTEEHRAAIDRRGPCAWHRMTFGPVAQPSLFAPEVTAPAES